jgi:hypothetical protein
MAGDPKNPEMGEFHLDGSEFLPYGKDLPPGKCQGMLTARDGFNEVCAEILMNQAAYGGIAGIPDHDADDLTTCNERIARIDAFLPPLLKFVEILTETRYFIDDRRQRIILDSAQSVDRRAKKNPELFAKYEKTRAYRSAIAKKALKTKEKNAAEEQAPGAENGAKPEPEMPATP